MKTHTSGLTTALKTFGRELNAKITFGATTYENDDINRMNILFKTDLLKTVMKSVEFECNYKIPKDTSVNIQVGVKVSGSFEYLDYGNYVVTEEASYNADTKSYSHVVYDKMVESMVYYDDDPLVITYPQTVKQLLQAICTKLGWTLATTTFTNDDIDISEDLYDGIGYTYRDILDDISQTVAGNLMFNSSDQLIIKTPTATSETIDDDSMKGDGVEIGEKYGPVNRLVLSRAEDGDTIYREDSASIIADGLTEFKIEDNLILESTDREDYIDEIWTAMDGLEYYVYDIKTIGLLVFEPLDVFTIEHDSVNYSTIMLNSEIELTGGLVENCFVDQPEEDNSNYEASSTTDKGVKNAIIQAYKNKAEIELKVSEDGVISAINLSPELITIQSSKISLEGYVSINNSFFVDEYGNLHIGEFLDSGKYNLLVNSSGLFDFDNWTISNASTGVGDAGWRLYQDTDEINDDLIYTLVDSGSLFHCYAQGSQNTGIETMLSDEIEVSGNTEYAFSARNRAYPEYDETYPTQIDNTFYVQIIESYSDVFSADKTTNILDIDDLFSETWQDIFTTFTTDANTVKLKVNFYVAPTTALHLDNSVVFEIGDILLDEYSTQRPWTNTSNEEDYGFVQITRSHIKVFDNSNTTALIDISKGGAYIYNNLEVGNDLDVGNDANITNNANIGGNADIEGHIDLKGNIVDRLKNILRLNGSSSKATSGTFTSFNAETIYLEVSGCKFDNFTLSFNGDSQKSIRVDNNSGAKIRFITGTGAYTGVEFFSSLIDGTDKIFKIVMRWNGTGYDCFINGVKQTRSLIGTGDALIAVTRIDFGWRPTTSTNYTGGNYYDVRLDASAISEADALALTGGTKTSDEVLPETATNLVYTDFDNETTIGNSGTISGANLTGTDIIVKENITDFDNLSIKGIPLGQKYGKDYSYGETETGGVYLDGKKIYKKSVYIGTLPSSAGYKGVNHGITNPEVINIEMHISNGTGTCLSFPYTTVDAAYVNTTQIQVHVTADRSAYTAIATLYYTK